MTDRTRTASFAAGCCVLAALSALLSLTPPTLAAPSPGAASSPKAVVWSPDVGWPGRQVNLGPTGAWGWMDGCRIRVVRIAPGSPADGVLDVGDALVAAGGAKFAAGQDSRKILGRAITAAETRKGAGKLALGILRGGRRQDITVTLPVLGSYSATWPADCDKSRKILLAACRHLAAAQYPNGHIQSEFGMATMWAGLLWLASGEEEFLPNVRLAAYALADQKYTGYTLNAWPAAYAGMFLAEYYLATGDTTVREALKRIARVLEDGQMACGSWGHSCPWGGYGAVNQVGLACLIALELIDECGLAVDQRVIGRSIAFFRPYAGVGWIPYGDHSPWRGETGNGKNALAAVAFELRGGLDKQAHQFAASVAAGYAHRETGHTGPYFAFFWGPLAARLAGPKALRTFLDEQTWYYDLARTWRGGLVCQPNAENLSGRTPGSYTWGGSEYTTAGMALFYAMPRKKLRILGGAPGVFARKLTGPVAAARELYRQQRWGDFSAALAALKKDKSLSAAGRAATQELSDIDATRRRSVTRTLARIEALVDEGDVYRADEMLKALQRLLGKDAPDLADAKALLEKNGRWIETGRDYYKAWHTLREYTSQSWHYYGKKARRELGTLGPNFQPQWIDLALAGEAGETTDTPSVAVHQWADAPDKPAADRADLPAAPKAVAGWQKAAFDDATWPRKPLPVTGGGKRNDPWRWTEPNLLIRRTFSWDGGRVGRLRLRAKAGRSTRAEIYLNGVLVARLSTCPWRRLEGIALAPGAEALLKKGANVLAVQVRAGNRGQRFDLGLQAERK